MAEMAATKMKYNLHNTRDNRYFKYGIQIHGMLNFHAARNWFSQTYGVGADVGRDEPISNEHWAFHLVYQTYMLYVRGDDELAWFKLKYGEEA